MNRRPIAALLLFASILAVAAEDAAQRNVKIKAEEMARAVLKGDFDKIIDLTYPEIVEEGGGRAKLVEAMKEMTEEWKAKGFEIRSSGVGNVERVVAAGDKRFAVVPLMLEMKAPNGKLAGASFLLGVSMDKGKTWTFLHGEKAREEGVKKMLDLPETLKLPEKSRPVFTPNAE